MINAVSATFGTAGISTWIQQNVITVLILVIAASVLWAARGGNIGKGITMIAGLALGMTVLGLATGTNAADIGTFVVGLFKS